MPVMEITPKPRNCGLDVGEDDKAIKFERKPSTIVSAQTSSFLAQHGKNRRKLDLLSNIKY